MAAIVDERALDAGLAGLEAARNWSPRVISRLEAVIREGDDAQLFRLNPLTLARQRDIAPDEAVDLLLHATAQGLFEMDWLLVCPRCACAVESFARLRAVLSRYRCPQCHNEYEAAMDDFIAVYFNVAPAIAATRYQRPETLEPFDYMFHYKGVREGHRPDGVPYIDGSRDAMLAIGFLEPGRTTGFHLTAPPGLVVGISADTEAGFALEVAEGPSPAPQRLVLSFAGNAYRPEEVSVAAGPVELDIANPTDRRCVVALLAMAPGQDDGFLRFDPFLTGKGLLTSQTFRSLFRSEVVGGAQGLAIRDIAILFTDIKGSTELYRRIGDLNAYQLVQQHFDWLREATVRHGGAVVKTIGDAVMAAYPDAASAVAAALAMRTAAERQGRGQAGGPVELKIGLHHGAAIAVTLNDELDYFGQTVNVASRVQEEAGAQEICLTAEVWDFPGVRELLAGQRTAHASAAFRGLDHPTPIVRIAPPG
ncbi:MAG: DUF5939 domain-containing protein [Geminicoccaceae bacterium]